MNKTEVDMSLNKHQQENKQGGEYSIMITWERYVPRIQKYYFAAYKLKVGYLGLK